MTNVIAAFDRAAMRRVAETDSRFLDLAMPRLSRLANHGLLWIALAAGLHVTGDRWARRAAWRGLGGLAAASATANLLGKGLAARDRPDYVVPRARQLARAPRTTSFPSGHAASAAAFATGVALEKPKLAAPVIAVAAAVGASRVVTGVHYPSDVLAGFAIGAAAGAMTLHWWPRRPPDPAAAIRPPREVPAAPGGEGLVLAVNTSAGTVSAKLVSRLHAELPQAAIIETHAGQDLAGQLRQAAGNARILGVAGGDGTVRTAASVALELGLPLLVIPAGTFNHFAADLGVLSADDALAALRAGEAVLVDVGMAGNRAFLNTCSTGVYVDLVHAREELEGTLGRRLAVIIALVRVLRQGTPHELILNGRPRQLWLYFAGNCRYEPQGTAPAYRPNLSDGYLDIRVVDAGRLARTRLAAAVVTGTLRGAGCITPGRPSTWTSHPRTAGRSGCPLTARWLPLNPASGRASACTDCWRTGRPGPLSRQARRDATHAGAARGPEGAQSPGWHPRLPVRSGRGPDQDRRGAAWKETFDGFLREWSRQTGEQFVPFDPVRDYEEYVDGKPRADGTRSFLASRGIHLPEGRQDDPPDTQTVHGLSNRKNMILLRRIREGGVRAYDRSATCALSGPRACTAVVPSSANCRDVVAATRIEDLFAARIDGIAAGREHLRGKLAPDSFLRGRTGSNRRLPRSSRIALAGVAAGRPGGFGYVVGVDRAGHAEALRQHGADVVVTDLANMLDSA